MSKRLVRIAPVDDSHLTLSLHPIIKQIYARRGVSCDNDLELKLSRLLSVESLKGILKACELLHSALLAQQKIIIIGDFDADGATSTALMMEGLSLLGSYNHSFLVPNRFDYGYGLTPEIADVAIKQGAEVIVTVDNGISCHQGVAFAKAAGCKVIITDHHLAGHTLPNADAIVNPNQPECDFSSKSIAGVGVAFYLMMSLRKYLREQNWFFHQGFAEPNLAQLLDLVALGTVADVVSLDANNRILVSQGLQRMRAGLTRPGIQALAEVAGRNLTRIVASDLGFAIGPRINAAGRLDDMSFGINCLLAKDIYSARRMAQTLDELNKARREIEQSIQYEAEKILSELTLNNANLPKGLVMFQPDWHQGVIGIVAGRLKEKYHRPSIVFACASDDNSTEIKGSARSIPGLHIRDVLEAIDSLSPNLIIKYGGHAMAAGLSIDSTNLPQFEKIFQQVLEKQLSDSQLEGIILSDGELTINEFNLEFAQLLQQAGPWGQNFAEPMFDGEFDLIQQRLVGEKHLKLVLSCHDLLIDAIAFNVDLSIWPHTATTKIWAAYRLDINEFRGQRTVQLMIEQLEPR